MASVVDRLVIALGLDSEELNKGLENASKAVSDLGKRMEVSGAEIDQMAASASKSTLMLGGVSDEVAERIMAIGTAGQKASLVTGRAMDDLAGRMGKLGTLFKRVVAPFVAVFSGQRLFQNLSQTGESLDILSERTGVATDKIDAWAKANRDAGGSEEAFKSALESWTVDKRRSADEFFRMGEAVKGMTDQQASHFLNAMGLSQDAAAVFTKFKDSATDAAEAYKGVAFTPEQAKAAREMNIRWRQFTDQAQALANMLAVTVLPVVNKVLKVIGDGVAFVREHSRAVKLVLAGVGTVLAATYGRSIIQAITASSTFFKVLKSGQGIMAALNATMLANPVAVVTAAVVALALAFDDLFAFIRGGNSILGRFLSFIGVSDERIQAIRETCQEWLDALINLPAEAVKALGELWGAIKSIGSSFKEGVADFFGGVGEFFASLPDLVVSSIEQTIEAIGALGDAIGDAIERGIQSAIDWAMSAFKALIDQLSAWIADALNIGGKIEDAVSGVVDSAKNAVKDAFGGVADFFTGGDEKESKASDAPAMPVRPVIDYGALRAENLQRRIGPEASKLIDYQNAMFEYSRQMAAYSDAQKAKPEEKGILSRLGDAVSGFFRGASEQAAGGMAASAAASSNASGGVSNAMEINVTNNIQTNGDPEAVGQAVGGAMDNALSRRNRMLVAAQSGVISK